MLENIKTNSNKLLVHLFRAVARNILVMIGLVGASGDPS